MSTLENFRKNDQRRTRYLWGIAVVWTVVAAGSLLWNIWQVRHNTEGAARIQARVAYEKDVVYRRWNAGHGGVYVPVTKDTQPNPYLSDIPERNLTTSAGQQLTLMNPAYMTRQVHELHLEENGVLGHITSLNPIRPENVADEWETEALLAFENGATEISSIELLEQQEYMRLMRPLITEAGCLKCHASQGYREGDIRGGISVSVPMAPLLEIERDQMLVLWAGHISLWLLGLGGIYWMRRQLERGEQARLRTERTLMESEYRFRAIFEQTNDAVFIIDLEGEHLQANRRAADMLKYTPDEMMGMRIQQVVAPSEFPESLNVLEELKKGRKLRPYERVFIRKDGLELPVEVNVELVHDKNGAPLHIQSIVRDITERRRVEQALRESEAKLQSIFRAAPIGIGLVGEQRQILWVNDTLCEMLGYASHELEGQNARFVYLTDEDFEFVGREKYKQISEKGTGTVETRWQRKDGAIIDVLLSSTPLDPEDRSVGVTFTALDITEWVEADNQLQQRADQLELLRQASLKLTANLALELVLDAILEQAMQLVTANDAHIYLYEEDVLHFGAARWADGRPGVQFAEPRQNGLTYNVARSGEPLSVPDMSNHPLFDGVAWEGAILGFPLKISDTVVGVMNVALEQSHEFDEGELRILELLADQAAIAIENARLHEQVQDHAQNLEERVRERTAELKKIISLMAGREVRMAELKKVIKKLRSQLEEAGMTPAANDPLEEPIR